MTKKPIDQTSAPNEEAQVDEAPVDEVMLEDVLIDEVPIDEVPLDEVPLDEVPLDEVPLDEVPLDEVPLEPEPPPPPPELPPLEEITFPLPGMEELAAPQPDEIVAAKPRAKPAPKAPEPAYQPRALSARRFAILEKFADALVPGGGAPSASDAGVARAIDVWLSEADPALRAEFDRALSSIEIASLMGRSLRPFSRLVPAAARAVAARMRSSRVPVWRAAAATVAETSLNQWAATTEVEKRLGFDYGCASTKKPRARQPLEVLSYPQIARDHVESCDVVVVGSGAGGAVVAAELAEAGLSVIVVEEGDLHGLEELAGPPLDRARRLYRRSGQMRARGRPDVTIPLGMGIGGSTLVGYGSAYRATDEVLLRWEKELGIPDMDASAMRPWFDRIERTTRVQPVPAELLGPVVPRIRDAAHRLGAHGGTIRRMIDGCRGCGTCTVGCPSDAKLGTHLTELPRAQQHGATLYANARAERILISGGRARGIIATLLDPSSRRPRASLRIDARAVVLAAGAVHTPALLADNALGNRSGMLGRNLSLQPTATVGGFFDNALRSWRGTQQPYALDEWLDAHGLLLEVTSAVPSIDAGWLPGSGRPLMERLERFGHLATIRVSVADDGAGQIKRARRGGEPQIRYRMSAEVRRRLMRGIGEAAELLLAAGAREVWTGLPSDPVTTEAQATDLATTRAPSWAPALRSLAPSGSVRMGPDPADSVTDPRGAVHGVGALWIADASMLPTATGVAPQLTVMALAARAAEHIARDVS